MIRECIKVMKYKKKKTMNCDKKANAAKITNFLKYNKKANVMKCKKISQRYELLKKQPTL